MSKAIYETNVELENYGDYNNLSVTCYQNDNKTVSLYFNPETIKEENGVRMCSFMMFSNGAKRIQVPSITINRLTSSAKEKVRDILVGNRDNLVDTFREVVNTNQFPVDNTKVIDDLIQAFKK